MTAISSPGLKRGLALVVEHFGDRQHAFRFGADIHDDVSGCELQHRALDDVVFTGASSRLGGEILERGCEILGGG